MVHEPVPLDVSTLPEVARLADEVYRTNTPRLLRRHNQDMAVIVPITTLRRSRTRKAPTKADYEAFLASAGGWKEVDTDKLIADIYESRRSSRPPVDL